MGINPPSCGAGIAHGACSDPFPVHKLATSQSSKGWGGKAHLVWSLRDFNEEIRILGLFFPFLVFSSLGCQSHLHPHAVGGARG